MASKKGKKTRTNDKWTMSSFVNRLHEELEGRVEVTRKGEARIKKAEVKEAVERVFFEAWKQAARGERVRFPVIGTLSRKEVPARKSGKGVNPFTGEPMTIKARPASKKPRWSFPKTLKEDFAKKTNWK